MGCRRETMASCGCSNCLAVLLASAVPVSNTFSSSLIEIAAIFDFLRSFAVCHAVPIKFVGGQTSLTCTKSCGGHKGSSSSGNLDTRRANVEKEGIEPATRRLFSVVPVAV